MIARVVTTLLLACAAGCISDPKRDPCRDPATMCDADAGDRLDASQDAGQQMGRDGGLDASSAGDAQLAEDAGQPDAARDAGQPRDAGPLLDAARDSSIRWDASRSEAGEPREPMTLPLTGDLGVHDPSIIDAAGTLTIFSTGRGIRVKRSSDLLTWQDEGRVFDTNPAWIQQEVPGATDLWAPDIVAYNGKFHLYYSASTFGSRNSCIGHAVGTDLTTLDFVDQGPVICTEETDDYNAIDPAFIVDDAGTPWLSFGSFWSGIKLIRLDQNGQRDGTELYSLASRDSVEAIEAPHILKRGDFYYLFVSFDLCCRGTGSTYRIMVGRSENITGPYLDAEGDPMLSAGGGSTVVMGNQRWRGPGHNTVLTIGQDDYLVYHSYDANFGGAATLRISELLWDEAGWPIPAGP